MILLKPDMPPADLKDKKLVFLAGPIMGAENWQARATADLADLDVYVADPRRERSENFDYDRQVGWESFYLSRADVVMFWLPLAAAEIKGRSYAQTTRFELGEWLGRTDFNRRPGKTVVIGIEEGFAGKSYLCKRCEGTPCTVFDTYEQTLAEVRRRLQASGRVFFTSDTHFGSERTRVLSRRPFASVEEMNWALVANWNRTVGPQDTVWHLGDFGDLAFAAHLNGSIRLVLGNYEVDAIRRDPAYRQELERTFASVDLSRVIRTADGEQLHLSHKPSAADREMFNAFGHIHGRQKCKRFGLDVGVDGNHFAPLSEEDLLFFKRTINREYDEEVFC